MICFPLDNTEYEASALGAWLGTRTRGVFAAEENMAVAPAGGMNVAVKGGLCWLKMDEYWGTVCHQQETAVLAVGAADSILHRIDAVCVRLDKNANRAEVRVKAGEPAANPVLPAVQRDINVEEIYLAAVQVNAGMAELDAGAVRDLRLDERYCGLMRDGVTGIPTEGLRAQAEEVMESVRKKADASMGVIEDELARLNAGTEVMLKTQYATDATAAMAGGGLTVTSTYAHPGTDYDVRFVAPDGFDGAETFTLDGDAVTVRGADMEESSLEAAPGAVVNLSRHGDDVFPKGGSGNLGIEIISAADVESLPPRAKEGTIGIITENAFSFAHVVMGDRLPERMVENGDVLLRNYVGRTLDIDASKNKKVEMLLAFDNRSAWQYVDSVLTKKYGYAFKNSKWNPFPLSVYNKGSQEVFNTSGWGRINAANNSQGSVSFGAEYMTVYAAFIYGSNFAGVQAVTNQKIDLTPYKTMHIKYGASTSGVDIVPAVRFIATPAFTNGGIVYTLTRSLSSAIEAAVDISSYNGLYHVAVGMNNGPANGSSNGSQYIYLHELWFE